MLIGLKQPEVPLAEATLTDLQQNAAERQARVLAVLTPSDFTLIRQYEVAAALFGRVTLTGVQKLATHPDVVGVGINVRLNVTLSQSGPLIHADQTRFLGINGTGVNVAVLDTGIDTDHPDLSDSIIGEKCFLRSCPAGANSAEDDEGHGTNVSGIITSNGSVTPAGSGAERRYLRLQSGG